MLAYAFVQQVVGVIRPRSNVVTLTLTSPWNQRRLFRNALAKKIEPTSRSIFKRDDVRFEARSSIEGLKEPDKRAIARENLIREVTIDDEDDIDLGRAATFIAMEEYPELRLEDVTGQLDTIAEEIQSRIDGRYPMKIVRTINTYLFDDLKLRGNADDYYNPRNSYISDVLSTKLGIPITLSLIYLEIAKRLDFPMEGVGMPAHFLVRPKPTKEQGLEEMDFFVDPYHKGEILFRPDCHTRLAAIYGKPKDQIAFTEDMLAAVPPKKFLFRLLRNLKGIYLTNADAERALRASDRLILLDPSNAFERRDRGLLLYSLERWRECILDLQLYSALNPNAEDVPVIQKLLVDVSMRL